MLSWTSPFPKPNIHLTKQLHHSETLTWNSTASWPQALHTSDTPLQLTFFLIRLFFLNLSIVALHCCVVFSRLVLSNSLRPLGLQPARLPRPSLSPGVCSNSCPLSYWSHPTISSSVVPFSSYPQSFPASGSFPMSWLFTSGGQSIGASVSASVLPVNVQGWFPLGLTGLISLQSKGHSRVFSSTPVQKHQSLMLRLLYGPISHLYMTTGKTIALTMWTLLWGFAFNNPNDIQSMCPHLTGEVFSRLLKLCLEEQGICENRVCPVLTQLLLCHFASQALIQTPTLTKDGRSFGHTGCWSLAEALAGTSTMLQQPPSFSWSRSFVSLGAPVILSPHLWLPWKANLFQAWPL